jgi:NAD(P)-dependent dehydrogenase (short-subunit alcohol dehydrogenase family)
LEGKVAVVTGAGSGIGRGASLVLAQNGARLVVNDVNPDSGAETAKLIQEAGGEATFIQADVGIGADAYESAFRIVPALTEDKKLVKLYRKACKKAEKCPVTG